MKKVIIIEDQLTELSKYAFVIIIGYLKKK